MAGTAQAGQGRIGQALECLDGKPTSRAISDVTSTGAPGPSPAGDPGADRPARRVHLHGWRHPAILAVAAATVAAGFAQFGATTALGDVARAFGESGEGTSLVARVGLSGTTLGVGLAIVRLASLASLPLAALADRHGRRRMLLACVSGGLAVTALAALSPGYWWFVALFALGRPLLSATNAVSVVVAAEETETRDRAKAIALMTAGYGIGAGLTALVRGVAGGELGFRGLFALTLVPLAAMPLLARRLEEPDRFQRLRAAEDPELAAARPAVLGRVRAELRPRLGLLAILVASAYAPAFGALSSELFPTSVRATVAGWLVAAGVAGAVAGLLAFGLLTDALDSFASAAVLICAPVVLTCVLFARLPETRGLELEQSAPD